jgi:hypothetical protein
VEWLEKDLESFFKTMKRHTYLYISIHENIKKKLLCQTNLGRMKVYYSMYLFSTSWSKPFFVGTIQTRRVAKNNLGAIGIDTVKIELFRGSSGSFTGLPDGIFSNQKSKFG